MLSGFVSAIPASQAGLHSTKALSAIKPIKSQISNSCRTKLFMQTNNKDEPVSEQIILDAVRDFEIQKRVILAVSLALPWVLYSEVYVLWKGCWALKWNVGVIEGVSYTVMLGMVLLSALHRYLTGVGLPFGPKGLLRACEFGSYILSLGLILEMLHFYFSNSFTSICAVL